MFVGILAAFDYDKGKPFERAGRKATDLPDYSQDGGVAE
jgi:hypothetical protein